jgi:hypothetical protein
MSEIKGIIDKINKPKKFGQSFGCGLAISGVWYNFFGKEEDCKNMFQGLKQGDEVSVTYDKGDKYNIIKEIEIRAEVESEKSEQGFRGPADLNALALLERAIQIADKDYFSDFKKDGNYYDTVILYWKKLIEEFKAIRQEV